MIRVRDLHKSYPTRFGRKVVLENINFDLGRGERLGILGRNGAGKSTLIRVISGAEKPTSGTIERSMSVSWPLAFGGAFQPQLTGIDNIRFITSVYGQDFERNLAFVEDFAELGPYLREPVRSYSSGMRARLAFAISMIIEFDCFLIDEVGAVGDARFHDRCNRELFDVRGDRAMIIISHDASYVRDHCNRWGTLHDGKFTEFNDFEVAYETYKELIGANSTNKPQPVNFTSRNNMIDSSQHAALSDERFRAIAQQGDWARDQQQWPQAADYYAQALSLYPYQRSYWTQLGHVLKADERFAASEIAYRTAVALGEPAADVRDHLDFVITQQGGTEFLSKARLPDQGHSSVQPPAKPDIEMLTWLLGGKIIDESHVAMQAMREYETLDEIFAAIATRRELAIGRPPNGKDELAALIERAVCVFEADVLPDEQAQLLSARSPHEELMRLFFERGALTDWPFTFDAIRSRHPVPVA